MIRAQFKKLVDDCYIEGVRSGLWSEAATDKYTV